MVEVVYLPRELVGYAVNDSTSRIRVDVVAVESNLPPQFGRPAETAKIEDVNVDASVPSGQNCGSIFFGDFCPHFSEDCRKKVAVSVFRSTQRDGEITD